MELLLVLLSVLTIINLVFVVTHLRPLRDNEVEYLAGKRRNRRISEYFSFDRRECSVDKGFKKRMKPTGTCYQVDEQLFRFPSTAAALLKYKKHEWIIVAFERDAHVDRIWVNKGLDRSQVFLSLPMESIAHLAKAQAYSSVLTFHNHPNPDPVYLDCTRPSEQDLRTANLRAQAFNTLGVNMVAFVCERGRHYRYLLSPADSFLPLSELIRDMNEINGSSRLGNLSLHLERLF